MLQRAQSQARQLIPVTEADEEFDQTISRGMVSRNSVKEGIEYRYVNSHASNIPFDVEASREKIEKN